MGRVDADLKALSHRFRLLGGLFFACGVSVQEPLCVGLGGWHGWVGRELKRWVYQRGGFGFVSAGPVAVSNSLHWSTIISRVRRGLSHVSSKFIASPVRQSFVSSQGRQRAY